MSRFNCGFITRRLHDCLFSVGREASSAGIAKQPSPNLVTGQAEGECVNAVTQAFRLALGRRKYRESAARRALSQRFGNSAAVKRYKTAAAALYAHAMRTT